MNPNDLLIILIFEILIFVMILSFFYGGVKRRDRRGVFNYEVQSIYILA
mgnify:CR=1 FL=1